MMNGIMIEAMEQVQKLFLRTIFGFDKHYIDLLNLSGLPKLESRMSAATTKFALSLPGSRFDHWVPRAGPRNYDLRNPRPFAEEFAHTDRLKKSPVFTYRRILNRQNQA